MNIQCHNVIELFKIDKKLFCNAKSNKNYICLEEIKTYKIKMYL